jgi:hypothetical protein
VVAAWREEAGIKGVDSECRQVLEALSLAAFELIKIIPLETSGIRDGDGNWCGYDAMHSVAVNVMSLCERFCELRQRGY